MKKIALITGGSRGIGLVMIKSFALQGYQIVTTTTHENGEKHMHQQVPDAEVIICSSRNISQENYSSSKAAVAVLTQALAIEGGLKNTRVNCITPGFIDTDMTKKINPEQREKMISRIHHGKIGHAEEITDCALFLANTSYITGQIIQGNGGMFLGS